MSDIESETTLTTYYTLLNVEDSASAAEVRKAYLKKAAECHPDKHPDDESATERFQALGEAYECLKDPEARKKYDLKLVHLRQAPTTGLDYDEEIDIRPAEYAQPHGYMRSHHHPHGPFFAAGGFASFPPFLRGFSPGVGIMPIQAAMAMFADLMTSFPISDRGGRPGGEVFDLPFGTQRDLPHFPNLPPFGLGFDIFEHPSFRPPFQRPGMVPLPPHPHLRQQRPYPHPQHRSQPPYPFHHTQRPLLVGPGRPPMMSNLPGVHPMGPGNIPGRNHRATFAIKDPAGRTRGYVQQSTTSWSMGYR